MKWMNQFNLTSIGFAPRRHKCSKLGKLAGLLGRSRLELVEISAALRYLIQLRFQGLTANPSDSSPP